MGLSAQVRRELEAERDRLAKQIVAIDALLALEAPGGEASRAQGVADGIAVAGGGLRNAILDVLQASGRAMRPLSVTRALEQRGFHAGGETELKVRVANELWRLAKGGKIGRTRQGYAPRKGAE